LTVNLDNNTQGVPGKFRLLFSFSIGFSKEELIQFCQFLKPIMVAAKNKHQSVVSMPIVM
jgi:hypothetical protein